MYYYILDYAQNQNFINFQKKLKEILVNLNISGEMAVSSPARSAEEIAQMALERGYTTLVAVGGDLLVNRLASVVAGSPAALGVIPYNLSPAIGDLFCGTDLKSACQCLKQRKTRLIDLGFIKPNKFFLSDLSIQTEKSIKCIIEADGKYSLESEIFSLSVDRELNTTISTQKEKNTGSWWRRSGQDDFKYTTSIRPKHSLDISTTAPVSVTVCDNEIVKTPIKVAVVKEVLKIIVNRDTIN